MPGCYCVSPQLETHIFLGMDVVSFSQCTRERSPLDAGIYTASDNDFTSTRHSKDRVERVGVVYPLTQSR
jgi:hypothetical protein